MRTWIWDSALNALLGYCATMTNEQMADALLGPFEDLAERLQHEGIPSAAICRAMRRVAAHLEQMASEAPDGAKLTLETPIPH